MKTVYSTERSMKKKKKEEINEQWTFQQGQ